MTSLLYLSFVLFLSSCVSGSQYPAEWWQPVEPSRAKSWEILPQKAKSGEVILSKRNELGLLSNFAETPFVLDGHVYQSVEGFWQMMKYPEGSKDQRSGMAQWPHNRQEVSQMVSFKAKRAGSFASQAMKKNKIDWVTYRGQKMIYKQLGDSPFYKLIQRAMHAKVEQNQNVKRVLLATCGLQLRPDHHQSQNVPKAWRYYDILMEMRDPQCP